MNQPPRPSLFLSLLIFVIIASLGSGCFFRKSPSNTAHSPDTLPLEPPPPPDTVLFPSPGGIPAGTMLKVEGSASLVKITQNLKTAFETKFPGTTLETQANGNEDGIEAVLAGRTDLAGISRLLSAEEQTQGLVALPIASDQIAVVVGADNPYQAGLTQAQVYGIFSGQITNWSEVGGQNATIGVLNRPAGSETQQLKGACRVWGYPVSVEAARLDDGQFLVVIAPPTTKYLVRDYALRWGIETLFGIFKTRGFCLESTHFTEPERLRKLFALLTLALCWSMRTGLWLHQYQPITIKKHGRRAKSLFRLGFDHLRHLV